MAFDAMSELNTKAISSTLRQSVRASRWVRVANVSVMTDVFLVAAVLTIVVTRSYLAATGYPQVGGNGLHVSHMLWGGLLLTAALLWRLLYIWRGNRLPAAIIGGAGFGLFVDEVGKFITSDNDYFFKPTFALIYIVIIGVYFAVKTLLAPRPFKPRELVLNALDFLEDVALGRLTVRKKATALYRLKGAENEPLAAEVRDLIAAVEPVAEKHGPQEILREWYERNRDSERFRTFLRLWFGLQIILLFAELAAVTLFVKDAWTAQDSDALGRFSGDSTGLSAIMVIAALTTLVCIGMTAVAIQRLSTRGLHPAYRAFENSLLLSMLVTQVLAFFESWVLACVALAITLPAWLLLRLFTDEEGFVEAKDAISAASVTHPADAAN